MSKKVDSFRREKRLSRRGFMAASGAGVAVASTGWTGSAQAAEHAVSQNPAVELPATGFDDLRSYIAALEERGVVERFARVDQDAFEGTAIIYKLIDEYGYHDSPVVIFEEVKIDGKWVKGPVLVNHQAHWVTESMSFGLAPEDNGEANYRKAMDHLTTMLNENNGAYPSIDPVEVSRDEAPCKEVTVEGDQIDIGKFAFIVSNPADVGRYVNTGSIYTTDPEQGMNFGTYRCEIKGPNRLSINSEPGQTGWRHMMAAKERGETSIPMTIVVGQDPIMWTVSSTRVPNRILNRGPVDEHAICGGLRGKAMELVKSDTNDFMVPAHAEMIIEGMVDLVNMEPEGPFGEAMGYLGPQKPENPVMTITRITHRRDPWIINSFTGVTKGFLAAPEAAQTLFSFKRMIPNLVDLHVVPEAMGLTFMSIDKTEAGQGLAAGERIASIVPVAKVLVVVDKDVNLLDTTQVLKAMGSRWQPDPAAKIYPSLRGMPLDPSMTNSPQSSKIVIDATEQLPGEGGPEEYSRTNRGLFEELAPDAMDVALAKWPEKLIRPRKYK